jgi:hypothetical protein
MITNSIIRKILPFAVLILLSLPIVAQDDAPDSIPFLEMLAHVPDIPMAREELYYADIRTAIATRPGTPQFTSVEAWNAAGDAQSWWIQGLPLTMPRFQQYSRIVMSEGEDTTGINFFAIERTISYGQPPATGVILQGDFDNAAIVAAYTENGWEVERDEDGVIMLCSVEGCDSGLQTNLEQRNVANPFGGELGRVEPIAVTDGFIYNSPVMTTIMGIMNVRRGDFPSLAESADVQAAVAVIAEQGLIRQAAIFAPELVGAELDVAMLLGERMTAENVEAALEELRELITPLPLYSFFMVAETANLKAEIQTAHVVLVYSDNESAQAAVAALEHNLQPDGLMSVRMRRPWRTLLDERGELQMQVIEHAASGRYVVLVSLAAPLVQADDSIDGLLMMSGIQFRLFMDMIFSRDTAWLVTSIPEFD